ncbi:nuclear transport factor 2 family protein [Flavobacterium alkalisoli]|uniref:Nuclear transport factor 2 family protein n=1 Tax=Flavobacterium alkalisoli TaxID=2602769 RepID=A0A5B9FTD6_9FLAO|nr:nuclear transport factor 2 family protein [Flavobacterium alkalisoli]QEE50260.1 nuclear transport factor 2 family protein [Flavobacterium alkalisoli]
MDNKTLASVLEKNLEQVWNQRNSEIRLQVIESLYEEDCGLFHVNHHIKGYGAINESVSGVLAQMPGDFIFTRLSPVVINNDLGRLIWGVGPKGKPPVQTGMDIVIFEQGRIRSLYVFLD